MNAIAIFDPSSSTNVGKISGSIKFHQCSKQSNVVCYIDLYGFKPNSTFACHIHEFGNISSCKTCGGHYNPYNKLHGNFKDDGCNRHAGDIINNVMSDNNGVVKVVFEDSLISLFPRKQIFDTIIGRSFVFHSGIDDLGKGDNPESKITGNAGGRIACSVIGLDKTEHFNYNSFI